MGNEYSLPVLTPLPLPVRVLVKGPSTVNWISWMGGPRTDFSFPRAMEAELLANGRPVSLRNEAVLGQPMREWFRNWEDEILQFSPDVLVLVPGHYECVHLFLPHWFERHANYFPTRSGRLARLYRKTFLRPIWTLVVILQAKIDARLPVGVRRGRRKRAVADLAAYVGHAQQVGRPLTIVMELLRPAIRQSSWFPGMSARLDATNEAVRELVGEFNQPNVRWFPTSEIAEKFYGDDLQAATPDGFHYTPELHQAIGQELAREILAWTDTQPHLRDDVS
jgi:hypothetical protein